MPELDTYLFSYGTLNLEQVQFELFGRVLEGKDDVLTGYKLGKLRITDQEVLAKSRVKVHPIAILTGSPNDSIDGTLFKVSEEELIKADQYEVDEYKRVWLKFQSGVYGWVYVKR